MQNRYSVKQYTNFCMENSRFFVLLFIILLCGCSDMGSRGTVSTEQSPMNYTFSGSGGKTTGPLKITRIELNFSNNRGEITVPINSRLRPYAVIRFDGNGLFRAAWEVDGRKLEEVAIPVTFGNTLTLYIREGTVLPTFEPGPHRLTLKVYEPLTNFEIPFITYFVTGDTLEK